MQDFVLNHLLVRKWHMNGQNMNFTVENISDITIAVKNHLRVYGYEDKIDHDYVKTVADRNITDQEAYDMHIALKLPIVMFFTKYVTKCLSDKIHDDQIIANIAEITKSVICDADVAKIKCVYKYNIVEFHQSFMNAFVKFMRNIVPVLVKHQNNVKRNIELAIHEGYPIDTTKGRPHITWKYCAHDKCGKKYNSCSELVEHLKHNRSYTKGYHFMHVDIIQRLGITRESIIEQNMTQCPSPLCNDNAVIKSPQDLIDHFTALGISPYWTPCVEMPKQQKKLDVYSKDVAFFKFFNPTVGCARCISGIVATICHPCGHRVLCLECAQIHNNMKDIKCPVCRNAVTEIFPYL